VNKSYGRYSMEIQWCVPQEEYVVRVPELPGCLASGKTYEEAARHIQKAIKKWIKEREAQGLPVPEPNVWKYEDEDEEKETQDDPV
jgi:predicted RNase H-like HicB family nuclease